MGAVGRQGSECRPTSRVFVGRRIELERLATAVPLVRFALLVGLPGVGKTALAAQFADSWPGPVVRRRVLVCQAGSQLLDELRRALVGHAPNLISDDERVADLARLLDREAALLALEDADRLNGEGRALLADLIDRLDRARIIATARTHVFPTGEPPERLQLVVEGLDREGALELWRQLDLLYGVRSSFEQAWCESHGNPFYLRRAHAGDLTADPLLSDTIAGLRGDTRLLALALAATDLPLPLSAIEALLPDGRGEAALDPLLQCLVAERISGQVAIHDLIRSAMLRAASPAELDRAHQMLADALTHAGLDPVVEVRERVRHMVSSGQRGAARTLVLKRAAELIRMGGSGELIRCLDVLMADDDPEIRLARARVLARMLDLRRAFEDLSHLIADRDTANARVRTSFSHLAMLTMRFDVAAKMSGAALADVTLDPVLRIRHAAIWLFTRSYQGHGESARSWLAEVTRHITDPKGRGMLAFARAFSLWLEERDVEAEEAMRTAWMLLEHDESVRAQVLAPTFWVTVLARVGKTEESQRALELAEAVLQNFEDPLIEVSLSALRATLLESRGDFQSALTEMTHTEQRWSRGGHTLGVYWARLHRGELLLRTGRVREGHHVLDDVARDAAIAGAELIVRQAAAARRADPRRGVVEFTPPSGPNRASANEPATPDPRVRTTRPGELRRDRVLAVFRAIAADELAVAQGRFAALMAESGLDPLEVALLELVRPAVEHAADACFRTALAHAAELAGVAGADPELIVELDHWLRDARSRKTTPIIVDEHSAEIRVGRDVVSLSTRPTLRRLFNALLAEPGRSTAKADLASTLWPGRYRPERHDNALWVNLKRLRDLLHGTGLRVVTDPVGYRVDIEDGYRLVRPRLGRAR